MKNLKLIYVSILIALFTLSSCTNDEPLVKREEASKSISARTAIDELQVHFNDQGALRLANNPTGNILFDYCFDFEYPVTFSYNTGATVTVNDFNGLIDVIVNLTDTLYVDGVVFPINVSVFEQGTVVVRTITNEQEFEALVNTCGFEDDACVYTDDFNPVCVEIDVTDGENFVVQFPNMSMAECEGFTQNDLVNCNDDSNPDNGGNDCFEFVYPLSIVDSDGNTIVITSNDDWDIAMYAMTGNFSFVYPFNVTILDTNTVQAIADVDAYATLLDTCYDDCICTQEANPVCVASPNGGDPITYANFCLAECDGYTQADLVDCNPVGNCSISGLAVSIGDCNTNGTYSLTINFNHENATNSSFDVVDANQNIIGYYELSDLPVTISSFSGDSLSVNINDNNSCSESIDWDAPSCPVTSSCWEFEFPIQLNVNGIEETVADSAGLNTIITNPAVQYQVVFPFDVTIDGATQNITTYNDFTQIGEWATMCD